jgi:NADH:ubiquinone oxidoreductase subunit 4 (subunit M)
MLVVVALLIKVPVGPFYHWLLKAHVEASTAGSIILASIMLKIPACAILRIMISSGCRLSNACFGVVLCLSIFTVLVATAQMWHESDLKRIVALSSVVHMGGSVLIIAASELFDSLVSVPTILALLVAHSFASSLMFAVSGMISTRYHTRDFTQISGLFLSAPKIAAVFLLGSVFTGAFPVGVVFISEAYAVSTLVLVDHLFLAVFLLVLYSFVFLRLILIYLSIASGESAGRIVASDMTVSEFIVALV